MSEKNISLTPIILFSIFLIILIIAGVLLYQTTKPKKAELSILETIRITPTATPTPMLEKPITNDQLQQNEATIDAQISGLEEENTQLEQSFQNRIQDQFTP